MPDRMGGMYRVTTLVLSAAMTLIGIALVVVTLRDGGGPLARGVVFGVLLALGGAGRLYFTWRRL